jgi:hypothetical protein
MNIIIHPSHLVAIDVTREILYIGPDGYPIDTAEHIEESRCRIITTGRTNPVIAAASAEMLALALGMERAVSDAREIISRREMPNKPQERTAEQRNTILSRIRSFLWSSWLRRLFM